MTNPGSDFIFKSLRELRGTLWDSMAEFHENHESGIRFNFFKAFRELRGTLWDLVGHPKIDFWHHAHVSMVEFRENHESRPKFLF
jgi:hypothetical protein